MSITLKSHGFKFSRPEANIMLDVSYFINPWRQKEIMEEKDHTRRRGMIFDFMEGQSGVKMFVNRTVSLLMGYDILFPNENIVVAICCSAGEFRSPVIVEMVGLELERQGVSSLIIEHNKNSKL